MKNYCIFILLFFFATCFAQNKLPLQTKLTNLNGETKTLEEVIKGDLPIIVTLWATWCKPCQSELEALKDLKENWEGKARIIAISVDDSRASAKVKSLVSGKKWPFEIYLDTNQEFMQNLNISNIPYAMVISSEGNIIYKHTGYSPGSESSLLEKVLNN